MNKKGHLFKSPLPLVVALLYFSVFIFGIMASNSKSTFLNITKDRFTKTPTVLTFGEQLMDFVAIAGPLLFAIAFVFLFFLFDKTPVLSATVMLAAALVALCGITVFVCLNAYNIIETFSELSKSAESKTPKFSQKELKDTLLMILPYHILLIFYAGALTSFTGTIKKEALDKPVKSGGLVAFSVANGLLAIRHLFVLITPSSFTNDYFNKNSINKSGFIFCELSNALCFATVAVFAYLLFRRHKSINAQRKGVTT